MKKMMMLLAAGALVAFSMPVFAAGAANPTSCPKGQHLVDADANGGTKCVASCKKGQHLDKTGRKCLPGRG
jgi:hypothetical protein